MADASIFAEYLKPVRSIADYADEADKRKLNALQLLTAQQGQADDKAMRSAYQQSGGDQNKLMQILQSGGQYKAAQALQKSQLDAQKSKSEIGHLDAQSGKLLSEQDALKIAQHRDQLANVNSPVDAINWADAGVKQGVLKPEQYQMAVKNIQAASVSPEAFNQWKQQAALGATKYIEMNKPTVHVQNLGDTSQVLSTPGLGGAATVLNQSTINQSPDNAATQATSRANNSANNAVTMRGQNMVDARAKDAQGDAENAFTPEAIKNAAARYNIDGTLPPMGMGKSGSLGRAAILNEAAVQASGVSPTDQRMGQVANKADFAAKQKTLSAFSAGKEAQAVRSFGVASSHLDTLGQLSDALNNGDIKVINKIGNYVSEQTGHPAPTNFDAAKRIVADEIVKSVTGAAGALGDRETADRTLAAANSPAQLKGVIETYKKLMDGQIHGLRGQYKAGTGRDDFDTKFNIKPSTPAASGVPADIADLLKKHGGK